MHAPVWRVYRGTTLSARPPQGYFSVRKITFAAAAQKFFQSKKLVLLGAGGSALAGRFAGSVPGSYLADTPWSDSIRSNPQDNEMET